MLISRPPFSIKSSEHSFPVFDKDLDMIAAMEKTQLHVQGSLVRFTGGPIFPFLNTDCVASRYPPKDHSERLDYHDESGPQDPKITSGTAVIASWLAVAGQRGCPRPRIAWG